MHGLESARWSAGIARIKCHGHAPAKGERKLLHPSRQPQPEFACRPEAQQRVSAYLIVESLKDVLGELYPISVFITTHKVECYLVE